MLKIITDSAADLSLEVAEEYGITVVPLAVNINEKSYRDRFDLTPAEFYKMLAKENALPTTSQVTPQLFMRFFKNWLMRVMKYWL